MVDGEVNAFKIAKFDISAFLCSLNYLFSNQEVDFKNNRGSGDLLENQIDVC